VPVPLRRTDLWQFQLASVDPEEFMSLQEETLTGCEQRIGYQFRDRALLRRCLTHSSAADTRLESNERLEFLGDAVLGLVMVQHLYQLYPEQREGQLTQMKSWLVSRQTCARVAKAMALSEFIRVGRGLQSLPESVMSAVVESLVAGVYLDGGLMEVTRFILTAFQDELRICQPVDTDNFKSQLQEYTQRELSRTPEYLLVEESGPDHAREFGIQARVGDLSFETGRGRSKKEAEQQAARNAILSLLKVEQAEQPASEPAAGLLVEYTELPAREPDRLPDPEPVPPLPAAHAGSPDDFGVGCDLDGTATDSDATRVAGQDQTANA
jgi:ribonuclease III